MKKAEKFSMSFLVQFAYRYDLDDGDFLKQNGYSGAQIETKLRILKVKLFRRKQSEKFSFIRFKEPF